MHPNWLQRCCVFITALFLVFQAFYIVGRHSSGPVTAEAAAITPESESAPTRIQIVKQAFAFYKKNHSVESLEESRENLLSKPQERSSSK